MMAFPKSQNLFSAFADCCQARKADERRQAKNSGETELEGFQFGMVFYPRTICGNPQKDREVKSYLS